MLGGQGVQKGFLLDPTKTFWVPDAGHYSFIR